MKRSSLLMVCALTGLFLASGHQTAADHFGSINFIGAFAQKEFKDNVDNGYGVSGGYAYGFGGNSPVNLLLGGELGFLIYGRETFSTPFSLTVQRVRVDVETTNNIMLFDLTAKLALNSGFFRPYAEGRAGVSYFFTESKIKDFEDETKIIASTKNFSDTTYNTALGAGFMVPVFKEEGSEYKKPVTLYIDFKFLYWWGGEAEYLKKGSISEDIDTGDLVYDVRTSQTNMTSVHIGVVFQF